MKKLCLLLFSCLILFACSYPEDLNSTLDTVIETTLDDVKVRRQDHNGVFYSFYLPSDIYQLESYRDAAIFDFNNEKILMNLNITSIIAEQENKKTKTLKVSNSSISTPAVYSKQGQYQDYDEFECHYVFEVYQLNNKYLVSFFTDDMSYYSYTSLNNLPLLTKRLFMLAKSMSVDHEAVMMMYSNVDLIDYTRKQVNLFETVVPKEGYLEDIVIGDLIPIESPMPSETPVVEEN